MNPILMAGTLIVTLALASYTIGIVAQQRGRTVTRLVLSFLTVGVTLDIAATVCMIVGSPNSPWTVHGFIGYSALAAMLTDTFLIWRHRLHRGEDAVQRGLHLYSRIAYSWWVVAYITGGMLAYASRTA